MTFLVTLGEQEIGEPKRRGRLAVFVLEACICDMALLTAKDAFWDVSKALSI